MDLLLIGAGRMGQAVSRVAALAGHTIAGACDSRGPLSRHRIEASRPDAAIDFSVAHATRHNVETCAELGLPLVVGTTGWQEDHLDEVGRIVEHHEDAAVLWAPNFSLGVTLMTRALRAVTPLIDRLSSWDVTIQETHHTAKRDSPSGTALLLAEILVDGIQRKTTVESNLPHGSLPSSALHVTSTRLGYVHGTHCVQIDGPHDHIVFSHEARSRDGFASGAIAAAEWLPGRRGLYTLDNVMDDWMAAVQRQTILA